MKKSGFDSFALLISLAILAEVVLAVCFIYFRWWFYLHLPVTPVILYPIVATALLVFFIHRITRIREIKMNYLKSFAICASILLSSWTMANILVKYFRLHPYYKFKMESAIYTGLLFVLIAVIVSGFFQQAKIDFGSKENNENTID